MPADVVMKLVPWMTPNYAQLDVPLAGSDAGLYRPKVHVRDLTPEALAAQCDQFRREMFKKAGKVDPDKGKR